VSKDVGLAQGGWKAWCTRSLTGEEIVRLILDGTAVKVRMDRKATDISVLVAIGVRRDGQKVLLPIVNMGAPLHGDSSLRIWTRVA